MKVKIDLVIELWPYCTREDISGSYAHFGTIWIPKRNQYCVQNCEPSSNAIIATQTRH